MPNIILNCDVVLLEYQGGDEKNNLNYIVFDWVYCRRCKWSAHQRRMP